MNDVSTAGGLAMAFSLSNDMNGSFSAQVFRFLVINGDDFQPIL